MDASSVGTKASLTSWLIAQGEQVPETWIVTRDVDPSAVERAAETNLRSGVEYAVRSSANVEDGATASYAGQFHTELGVVREHVADAVAAVRASAQSERVNAYRRHLGAEDPIEMAVMIQPVVSAKASGVAFSRNPMTGLNEVVVEAVAGSGDRLVDDGITPERWIRRWGAWTERSEPSVIGPEVAESIAARTSEIAEEFGKPVDLEWVWDGAQLWWVQLRPITGIEDISIYSNRISREVMPGIIKPLVWSVNVPMVNRAWVDLFTEMIGRNSIDPESLAKSFAYRSYFNMGAIGDIFELLGMPRDSLEVLLGLPSGEAKPSFKPGLGTMKLLPRMVAVTAKKSRYGKSVENEVAALMTAYRRFDRDDLSGRSDSSLLEDIEALSDLGIRAAYANIVTPLLANLYNTLLRSRLTKSGLDPESIEIGDTSTLEDVNPNLHLERLSAKLADVDPDTVDTIRTAGYAALPDGLRADVDRFLDQFGHLSSSGNDFSVTPWRENPDAVARMVVDHTSTHGTTERTKWESAEAQLSGPNRRVMRGLRNRTRNYIEHRERVSFTYTYGYGLFRRYFLEIGRRLVERGLLPDPDDIMYLYLDEVRTALIGDVGTPPIELVADRVAEIESIRDISMPEVIYGDDFVPVHTGPATGSLHGIPTSRGHHRGTVRVVRDTEDFGKVQPGDVIAIPYSDVAWTPLFARAGAVVAEAGGMLSHSSIVAREYRIPCVVSVPDAMRLPDGAIVTVDGYTGTVAVEDSIT